MPIQGAEFTEDGKKIRYKGIGYFQKNKETYCIQDGKIFHLVPIPPKGQGKHEYIELDEQTIQELQLTAERKPKPKRKKKKNNKNISTTEETSGDEQSTPSKKVKPKLTMEEKQKLYEMSGVDTIKGAEYSDDGKKIRYKGIGYFRKNKENYCIQDGKIFHLVPIPPKSQGRHQYIELDEQTIQELGIKRPRQTNQPTVNNMETDVSERTGQETSSDVN